MNETTPSKCCAGAPLTVSTVAIEAQARVFKALADRTRLEIVHLLATAADSLCACEIESQFDLSQPTVSHHLRLLRKAGLIRAERRGTWMHFWLEPDGVEAVAAFSDRLIASIESTRAGCCGSATTVQDTGR